jgi:hypothetical protein
MNELSDVQAAYLAGLIDGEGCLFISKQQFKRCVYPSYRAHLIIVMTSKSVIEYVHSLVGAGNVYFVKSISENLQHKYRWEVTNNADLFKIISGIMPFLIVKKHEAETALEFISSDFTFKQGPGRSRPKSIVKAQDGFYRRIMDLKTRGKGPDFTPPEPVKYVDPQMSLFG